jgi:EmrB/QacA subfamily drug resistance transporter
MATVSTRVRAGASTDASTSRPGVILAVCCIALFMVSLDNTVVNVALPTIEKSFKASQSDLQWIVDAYVLVLGSLLLSAGALGDRIGRRKIFRIGLVIFCAGSLACSLSPNLPVLILARMGQGIGGSMLTPSTLSIITNLYEDEQERARAIGLWGATSGMSIAIGPVLGGLLTESVGWPSVFWINLPIGAAAFVLAGRLLPESRADHPRALDPVAQILVVVLLAGITYGLIEAPSTGWASPQTLLPFAVFALAFVGFVLYERRREEPLIEFKYFKDPPFLGAQVLAFIAFFALTGFIFFNTLYLQQIRGDSALRAGLTTLPATVGVLVMSPLSGRVTAKLGPRWPLVVAFLLTAGGMVSLITVGTSGSLSMLFVGYVLLGAGVGTANPPITNAAVSNMPSERAGVASGMTSTSRQLGSVFGVSILGTLIFGGIASLVPSALVGAHASQSASQSLERRLANKSGGGAQNPQQLARGVPESIRRALDTAFTTALHRGYLLAACLAGVGVVLALLVMGRSVNSSAE